VDAHTLEVLEFPTILGRLAAATETEHGASLAHALEPSPNADEVARLHTLTSEGIALYDESAEPSLGGIDDVRDAAERAAFGASLRIDELHRIARSVNVALAAREALVTSVAAKQLRALLEPIDPALATVATAIDSAVEEDGSDLRDNASPLLRKLRAELRKGRHRAVEELTKLARSSSLRDLLQETFITERGGRPVLAVKIGARSKVPGIVHDASSSGQTLFVEPLAVVELNNELAEAAGAEREEVERIVRELSARIGEQAAALAVLVEATGAVDLAFARAVLSRRWRGAEVRATDAVRLVGARHPLLDPAEAVPIDLDLAELRALVISGPNTGGKTVALKTLGLAALLHQSGLRPPAVTAELPVFDEVLADIGDEQSIEMSLSTFSGHLRNIVEILRGATARSLVLLDELAAGTDPVEGSALAQSLVARLVAQARLTVVTTHYPELKEWASATNGAANAATGFDAETYAPLYEVMLGRPGTSQALRMAQRLGLDAELVADARSRVSPEQLRVAALLAEAQAAETAAVVAHDAALRREAEAVEAMERAREQEVLLAGEIETVRASAAHERELAVEQARRELEEARQELQRFREELRAARRHERERGVSAEATAAERDRDRRLGAAVELVEQTEEMLHRLDEPLTPTAPFAPGDPVTALELGVRGTIATVDGDEAEVIGTGGLRVRVPVARLTPDRHRVSAAETEPAVRVVAASRADVSDQLDVRGTTAQEAREAVRSLVDDAALAGLQTVHVVHGRGAGVLRAAVRGELDGHALVERYEPDSADGATLVHLA
jgi:DNA mismatch repair protein MutS2